MKAEFANSPMAPHLINANWGGESYPAYDGFASAAAVASPAVDPAAPAQGAPAAPASPAEGQQPAVSSPANDPNLKQLREGYERYKGESEKWGKLGDHDEVSALYGHISQARTQYSEIAKQLGYEAQDFAAAFKQDPFKTMQVIQKEYAKARSEGRAQPDANLDRRFKQLESKIDEHQNQQASERANATFDTTVRAEIAAAFPGEELPQEFSNLLYDAASEIFKYNDDGIAALKKEGKTAAVKAAFAEARDIVTKAFVAFQAHQSKKGTAPNAGGAPAARPKLSLDDIISGSDKAVAAMPSMRG